MAATTDGGSETRLDLARQQARVLFGGTERIALFSFASTGRRLTEFTQDEHMLERALETLRPTELPGRLDDVLRVVEQCKQVEQVAKVDLRSDEIEIEIRLRRMRPLFSAHSASRTS